MDPWRFEFGPFALDLAENSLWGEGRAVALAARDLAVLRHLLLRAGQLVSTDELLEAVWPDTFVVRGVVKTSLHRLRSALGDTHPRPSYVETVGRKGYRFIAEVRRVAVRSPVPSSQRAPDLARLIGRFEAACAGAQRIVFVHGESAADLAAMVEGFAAWAEFSASPWCVRGRCAPQVAPGEPFQALLEALADLGRRPFAADVAAILRRHAPLWLAKLPGLSAPASREALLREVERGTPEQMRREFLSALETLAAVRPVLLLLENLEWADPATLDLVSALAARRDGGRIFLFGTYDPRALDGEAASFGETLRSLSARQLAEVLPVVDTERDRFAEPPPVASPSEARRVLATLDRTPFVGRGEQLARLARLLETTRSGKGGVGFLVGEPGIGKTRLLEEFSSIAASSGACVLAGRCYDGELARPFGPFAEALAAHANASSEAQLRDDLGAFGEIAVRIAPELRVRLPGLREPAPLPPQEERPRLLDAIVQVLWAIARRGPLVLILDDLHWADGATLALLRHAARFLRRHPVLVLGAYRDVEVDRRHPLAETLAELPRELDYTRIELSGLDRDAVTELLEAIALPEMPSALVEDLLEETSGNPFFLRELIVHRLEEGKLQPEADGQPPRLALDEADLPDTLRQVIFGRLARLSEGANRLLAAASGCGGPFRFDVVAAVSGLDPERALGALDIALQARLLRGSGEIEVYEFSHALIRHALYHDMSLPRRARLHRRLAEELERCAGSSESSAIEIARHYQRSKSLPGVERGAGPALAAAAHAEKTGAFEEAAEAYRIALELLPAADTRRARAMAGLATVLSSGRHMHDEESRSLLLEATTLLAASEGEEAALEFLVELLSRGAYEEEDGVPEEVVRLGLALAGDRRNVSWAFLRSLQLDRQDRQNPDLPGIRIETPARREAWRHLLPGKHIHITMRWACLESRREAPSMPTPFFIGLIGGDLRGGLRLLRELLRDQLQRGHLVGAASNYVYLARFQAALGELSSVDAELARARELSERTGLGTTLVDEVVKQEIAYVRGEDLGAFAPLAEARLRSLSQIDRLTLAVTHCNAAKLFGYAGRTQDALREIAALMPAVERASGCADGYTSIVCWPVEVLWHLQRVDFAEPFERNLLAKTIEPDFRFPFVDARRAMAKLCALTGRLDEAREWFARSRAVLEEQGARPLRALIDFDEAEMEVRRGPAADRSRALVLLGAARSAFESIGMPGWLVRARSLEVRLERPR